MTSVSGQHQMRLWLLQPGPEVLRERVNPWQPPYDKTFGVVVRARDEPQARPLAQAVAGHEGVGVFRRLGIQVERIASDVWLSPAWTRCNELTPDGLQKVILRDYRAS
jgi:hypothetical protein